MVRVPKQARASKRGNLEVSFEKQVLPLFYDFYFTRSLLLLESFTNVKKEDTMSDQNTSSKTSHLHFTLRDNTGLTMDAPSYKVGLFSIQRECLGEAELKRARITLKIDNKEYLGKIPGSLDRQIELIDKLRNVVIYRSKLGFFSKYPIVVFDVDGNEVFQVTWQFRGQRYTALHKDQEIAVMTKKKGFWNREYSLSLDKSFFSDFKDPAALFMLILLMEIRDDVAAAFSSV